MNAGDNDEGRVAGSFTFQAQLPNAKTLSFSGYILAGDDEAAANKRLDMASKLVERQRLLSALPMLEDKQRDLVRSEKEMKEQLDDLLSKPILKSAEQQMVNTLKVNLKNFARQIDQVKDELAVSRQLAA